MSNNSAAERAKAKLIHFFDQELGVSDDQAQEIGSIVDDIVAAALVEVEQKIRQLSLELSPPVTPKRAKTPVTRKRRTGRVR